MTGMALMIGGVMLVAALLMMMSLFLPDLEIIHFESAIAAAVISYLLGNLVAAALLVIISLGEPSPWNIGWLNYVGRLVLSSVTLALGIMFAPKIRASLRSTIVAAVVVSLVTSGVMAAIAPLLVEGMPPGAKKTPRVQITPQTD